MAAYVKMARPAFALCAALCLVGAARAAGPDARELPDPTRPPASWLPDYHPDAPAQPGATQPILQSVLRPAKGAPRALIDGQWVEQGGQVGDYRVIAIGSQEALLRSEQGDLPLSLAPAAEKRARRAAPKDQPAAAAPTSGRAARKE